jgi:hypothetical protein
MYLDSSTPDLETDIDGLRKLISLYMAANVEIISEHYVHPCVPEIPACRKSLRAEKYDRYFDFKHVEFPTNIDVCRIFASVVFHSHM